MCCDSSTATIFILQYIVRCVLEPGVYLLVLLLLLLLLLEIFCRVSNFSFMCSTTFRRIPNVHRRRSFIQNPGLETLNWSVWGELRKTSGRLRGIVAEFRKLNLPRISEETEVSFPRAVISYGDSVSPTIRNSLLRAGSCTTALGKDDFDSPQCLSTSDNAWLAALRKFKCLLVAIRPLSSTHL